MQLLDKPHWFCSIILLFSSRIMAWDISKYKYKYNAIIAVEITK